MLERRAADEGTSVDHLVRRILAVELELLLDARSAAPFPNALLLDCGAAPVALHMSSDFLQPKDRVLKEKAVHAAGTGTWLWHAGDPMPELPPSTHGASRP